AQNVPTLRPSYNRGGFKALSEAKYADAERLFRRAIREAEAEGVEDAFYAASLIGLGRMLEEQGQYAEAEPYFRRSLQVMETIEDAQSPLLMTPLNDLAELYYHLAKYDDSERFYRRALALTEEKLGKNHSEYATLCHNIARLCEAQGKY